MALNSQKIFLKSLLRGSMMKYISIIMILAFINCTQEKKVKELEIMDENVLTEINKIDKLNIYFGHQSVGYNIIQGLNDIIKSIPDSQLNIIDIDQTREVSGSYFAHSKIGYNRQPRTKCDNLILRLNDPILKDVDIILSKFCYVDFNSDTNVDELFDYYSKTVADIKKNFPDKIFVHITVPLTTIQSDWKASIKKMLGKPLSGVVENVKRNKFNELIKNTYSSEPIFDLSMIESTYPDSSKETFNYDGKKYYALIPDYTNDGGHLNNLGSKIAARELIRVIAEVSE